MGLLKNQTKGTGGVAIKWSELTAEVRRKIVRLVYVTKELRALAVYLHSKCPIFSFSIASKIFNHFLEKVGAKYPYIFAVG